MQLLFTVRNPQSLFSAVYKIMSTEKKKHDILSNRMEKNISSITVKDWTTTANSDLCDHSFIKLMQLVNKISVCSLLPRKENLSVALRV